MKKVTYVYRAYNYLSELCYVGITNSLDVRINAHRQEKKWWSTEVNYLTVKTFNTRAEAELEEANAIATEAPKYNEVVGRQKASSVAAQEYVDRLSPKTRKNLPQEEVQYLKTLDAPKVYERASALADVGWPVSSILEGVRVAPSPVELRRSIKATRTQDNSREVPLPPLTRAEKRALKKSSEVHLASYERSRLKFLAKKVKNYRPGHTEGHPIYEAREEYNNLIASLYGKGVRVSEIAEAVGVDESNIRRRLR